MRSTLVKWLFAACPSGRRIVAGIFAAAVLTVTAGETRYLANGGDDAADGTTPATAWRTLEKASEALPAGATLKMKSGDVFYGQLRPAAGLDAERPTVVTSWGEGPKPVISATKNLKGDPSVWENRSHCFWRINLANPTNSTGIVTDDCNPGFLLVDGEVKPWKRFCHDDLVSPWDFCGEDGYLYVHADANPAKLAKDIRVALRIYCVQFGSFTVISNIAVRATGAHGMHGGWGCDLTHVRIADCEFENIGGSELPGYSPQMRIRFGNGIELGGDAEDVIIERCSFRGVYDVCFTMQGFPKKGWRNVHCRDCTMTDCTQAFEIWCGKAPKGVGFRNCSFTGNRTLRVGGGWGEKVRPCRAVATPLLIYGMETDTVDIDVTGNVFGDAPYGLLGGKVSSCGAVQAPIGYRVHDNVLSCAGDNPVKLMIPKADATVSVLTEGQKAFFALPDETRRLAQGNAVTRAEWLALGWHPQAVAFVWDGFKTRKARIRFRIWREEDNVCLCDTNFLYLTTGRFEWDNFRVGTAYRWGLDVNGKGSATSRFVTEDVPPRLIRVPGVPNLRDLGGWKTADGRRVRQGLLYRSANLCENAAECRERPPRTRMTPTTCHYMTNALGIRTELDLRSPRECEGLVVSPLGPSVRRVEISSGSYSQMNQPCAKEALLKDLRLVADARNLPLLFHCSGGRDRTGTLAFIINGLLGVSAEDLARDWDATALWDNERDWFNRSNSYATLLAVMEEYPGETLNERIKAYVKSTGFGDADIASIRALLLERGNF